MDGWIDGWLYYCRSRSYVKNRIAVVYFDDLAYVLGYKKLFLSAGVFSYYTHILATVRGEKLLYSIKFKFLISVFH